MQGTRYLGLYRDEDQAPLKGLTVVRMDSKTEEDRILIA